MHRELSESKRLRFQFAFTCALLVHALFKLMCGFTCPVWRRARCWFGFLGVLTRAADLNEPGLGLRFLIFSWRLDSFVCAGEIKMSSKKQESDLHKLRFVQQVGVILPVHGSACLRVVGRPLT